MEGRCEYQTRKRFMIPKPYIAQWQEHAPWKQFYQVEQDLIISRALVEIFSDEYLRENLAFRGGTALHKLFLKPAPRYSEDIDLVQIKPGPIKPIMQRIGEVITFFEEDRKTQNRGHGIKALYRFTSEYEEIRLRLKLEVNCKEHFNILEWVDFPFEVKSEWFSGQTHIRTYNLNELLGTKLRALYQRSKGRDLFDMDFARQHHELNYDEIIQCFQAYAQFSTDKRPPGKKEFLINLEGKENDPDFIGDLEALLRPDIEYNQEAAIAWLKNELIERI
jgi:predicted nucleotidyltransferase component of viral defense system